uniref:Putative secreted protein ovary overexpressed n=1 Tax=Rhipicephalus microplus TaxID=6941 RepID=A0A6M2D440_RHIMP
MADQECPLYSLPDDMLARIFALLSPEDVTALGTVSQRIRNVASFPEVLHYVSFHFTHRPQLLAEFLHTATPAAIVVLDLNNCIQIDAVTMSEGLRLCVNLTDLRCINTKILPGTLLALTANELSKLTRLEWALFSEQRTHAENLLEQLKNGEVTFALERLQHMHIEVDPNMAVADLLVYVLQRCPVIRSVHLHEQNPIRILSVLSHLMLDSYLEHNTWKIFSFTMSLVASTGNMNFLTAEEPLPAEGDIKAACLDDIARYGNLSVAKTPHYSYIRSCAKLSNFGPLPTTDSLTQLLLIVELPISTARIIEMANRDLRELRALTLANAMDAGDRLNPAKAALGHFISACSGLRELNLASFHVSKIDCCELLSQAVIPHLHSLSLPACALSKDTRLPQLVNASFRLRVLDVRGLKLQAPLICTACGEGSTCTSECLSSLRELCPLERLTLCGLLSVDSLDFLINCSITELRLRDLGYWCMRNVPMLSPLQHLCPQLHSLTLHGDGLPEDLLFLHHLQPAKCLRRLCVSVPRVSRKQQVDLLPFLQGLFPNANTLHVHALTPGDPGFRFIWTRLPNDDCGLVLPSDNLELCTMCDYTGLQKPFLGQYKYAHL